MKITVEDSKRSNIAAMRERLKTVSQRRGIDVIIVIMITIILFFYAMRVPAKGNKNQLKKKAH